MIQLKQPIRAQRAHLQAHAPSPMPVNSVADVSASVEKRGLTGAVRFFVDRAVGITVTAVTRKHAQRARLTINSKCGTHHIVVFSTTQDTNQGVEEVYIAHSNDMCFFTGSTPSLYIMHKTARDLEYAIYLYLTERLIGQESITAHIFREPGEGHFDLPVLEGSSELGPASIIPKVGFLTV